MTLLTGDLGARLDIAHRADGYLEVKGDTELSALRTIDNGQKRDFISWKDLRIAAIAYRSKPQSLHIKSVTAVEPYARMIIFPSRALNITEILKPAASA